MVIGAIGPCGQLAVQQAVPVQEQEQDDVTILSQHLVDRSALGIQTIHKHVLVHVVLV